MFSCMVEQTLGKPLRSIKLGAVRSGSHQCPEDRENSGSSQDKQPSQSLWVVGLHNFNDPQQCLDSRSPQVAHVQALQIHETCPTATEEEQR